MEPIRIFPQYAMILTYDVRPGVQERYFRFLTKEFLLALQRHKLYMQNAWHISYGDAPERQIEFMTEKLEYIQELVHDEEWQRLEGRLKTYVINYKMSVVPYRSSVKILRHNERS